jgi:hypothetical protein
MHNLQNLNIFYQQFSLKASSEDVKALLKSDDLGACLGGGPTKRGFAEMLVLSSHPGRSLCFGPPQINSEML